MTSALQAGPRYLVHDRLGAGGMAVVYRGTMVSSAGRREVAIKRLLGTRQADPGDIERIISEAQLVFQLTHANICQVLDLGQGEEGTFIVMEYVRGVDLGTLLKRLARDGQRLDVANGVHIAREVARALDYAHRRTNEAGDLLHLVHGDVTPRNIMLSVEGEVKLGDFGIARSIGAAAPGNELRAGTPGFMAPEISSSAADHRVDIYSLGVTLYHALARGTAGDELDWAQLDGISADLIDIVRRATAQAPGERFVSAGEMEAALALELSRRHPGFTAARLAEVVRGARRQEGSSAEVQGTLTSLTRRSGIGPARGTPSESASARGTETLAASRAPWARWKGAVIGLLVLGALGVAGFSLRSAGRRTADSSAEPAKMTATPAPPPARPEPARAPELQPPATKRAPVQPLAARPSRPAPAKLGRLTIDSVPWGVPYVDGKKVADETPVYQLAVPAGPHRVSVFYPAEGRHSPVRRVVVGPDAVRVVSIQP